MIRYLLFFIFLFYSNVGCSQNWSLIWSDEFNGNTLDNNKWGHDVGTGSQYGLWGWGNGELQFYQPQNTQVENGVATITAKEEPSGLVDSWGNTSYFSSSKITTKNIFDFRYGKVEARIKTLDGQGFWPAFWLLPVNGNWPCDGEIDIMEQWGNNYLTNSTTGAAHIGTCPFNQSTHNYENFSVYLSNGSYADEFHTYSIIWTEDTITWYVDEDEIFRVTPYSYNSIPSLNSWPFNSGSWYIMINLAITQSGPNANTVFPNNIEIDYVKVYQNSLTNVEENKYINVYFDNISSILKSNNIIKNFRLYTIDGKLIENKENLKSKSIKLKNLKEGVYLVEVEDVLGEINNSKIIIN